MEINTVGITGIVVSQPEKRNNLYGRIGIYRLWVDVERDSGTIDRILVLLQEGETETEETVTTTLYPVEYWQQPEVIIEKKAGKLTAEEIIKGFQPGSTVKESILRILPYVFLRRLHLAFTVTYLALPGKSWQNRQQDYGKAAKCI